MKRDNNLRRWLEIVAHTLAGKPVRVSFGVPRTKNASGEVVKDADGVPHITILPAADDQKLLRLFLHEVAHVKLHSGDMVAGTWEKIRSATLETQALRMHPTIKAREREADALTDKMLAYALKYQDKQAGSTLLMRELKALLIPPELRERALMIATKAALKVVKQRR